MGKFGEVLVSLHFLVFMFLANFWRTLLLDDGWLAAGIFSLPASTVPFERSKGWFRPMTPFVAFSNLRVGAEIVVWDRYSLWPLWFSWTCGRSLFAGHANAARFREGKWDLLSSRHNLQATVKIPTKSWGTSTEAKTHVSGSWLYVVFPLHCFRTTNSLDWRGYLVSNWACSWAAERCK